MFILGVRTPFLPSSPCVSHLGLLSTSSKVRCNIGVRLNAKISVEMYLRQKLASPVGATIAPSIIDETHPRFIGNVLS